MTSMPHEGRGGRDLRARLRRRPVVTACLLVLLTQGLVVGAWASGAPHSFFVDFPGLGLHWIGPGDSYDEHLVRDVGTLHLALAVGTAAALVGRVDPGVVGAMWLTMTLPHAVFHATATAGLTGLAVVTSLGALVLALLASVVLVVPSIPSVAGNRENAL